MRINGLGCALADYLYNHVDFTAPAFQKYRSRQKGDGGLAPGNLVFTEEFARYAGAPFAQALNEITRGQAPDSFNIGGPAIVALILAGQLLQEHKIAVAYYGAAGRDAAGEQIFQAVARTPLHTHQYLRRPGQTPFTHVLADPHYAGGHGERCFVNHLGVAAEFGPGDISDDFYNAQVTLFGATALTPRLHDHLSTLLRRARQHHCLTVVSTVYDFRNQKRDPVGRWPLGDGEATYPLIDLLVMDAEEALRLSGTDDLAAAAEYFRGTPIGACVITHGAQPVWFYARGGVFQPLAMTQWPVCAAVKDDLLKPGRSQGDTTGCGDNFAGGVLASLAGQLGRDPRISLDLRPAVAVGVCAGGSALFQLGGTFYEDHPGQQRRRVLGYYQRYRAQIAALTQLPENPW